MWTHQSRRDANLRSEYGMICVAESSSVVRRSCCIHVEMADVMGTQPKLHQWCCNVTETMRCRRNRSGHLHAHKRMHTRVRKHTRERKHTRAHIPRGRARTCARHRHAPPTPTRAHARARAYTRRFLPGGHHKAQAQRKHKRKHPLPPRVPAPACLRSRARAEARVPTRRRTGTHAQMHAHAHVCTHGRGGNNFSRAHMAPITPLPGSQSNAQMLSTKRETIDLLAIFNCSSFAPTVYHF